MLSIYSLPMAFDPKRFSFSDMYTKVIGDFLSTQGDAVLDDTSPISLDDSHTIRNVSYKSVAKPNELQLTVDVPGMDPSTIALKVQKNVVRIVGSVDGKLQTRKFNIVPQYDCDKASASYEFGRVTVSVPAYPNDPTSAKTIPIKIR